MGDVTQFLAKLPKVQTYENKSQERANYTLYNVHGISLALKC